jgi:NAD(P)-dependent dehydrogenase (short-subunit alcohol dehydrogenase family)
MNTTYNFSGRVAFVTGAASGIGRATALAFARAGVEQPVQSAADTAKDDWEEPPP